MAQGEGLISRWQALHEFSQVPWTPIPDNAWEHSEVTITNDLSGVRQQLISADWHGRWRAELSKLLPPIDLCGIFGRGS